MKHVYLLRMAPNFYKVGVGINVTRRVASLQTSNPQRIEVVMTRLVEDSYQLELNIHRMIKERWAGGGTEWFELTPEQALDVAVEICKIPELDMTPQITVRQILAKQDTNQKRIEDLMKSFIEAHPEFLPPEPVEVVKVIYRDKETKEPRNIYEERKKADEGLLESAMEVFKAEGKASTSLLQRRLRIGYGRAARVMETLEYRGLIPEGDGARARHILAA